MGKVNSMMLGQQGKNHSPLLKAEIWPELEFLKSLWGLGTEEE
jgi:hypothetical protein